MSELVTELRIVEAEETEFDKGYNYQIPLYQRAYAWEDKEIIQLIEDINDVLPESNYYIGSLIVSRRNNNTFEVIDGQQRLTTLFLLLHCLGKAVKSTLTFACRDKSNFTLNHIEEIIADDLGKLDPSRFEESIINGIKAISVALNDFNKQALLDNLKRVILYRIEVPANTDLNRYFEIMNTRGEQLEQHDILKATLMSYLSNDEDKRAFAKIWEACSDMTGYVQMHFISRNNEVREGLFGSWWNDCPPADWKKYLEHLGKKVDDKCGLKIKDIVKLDNYASSEDMADDDDTRVRFESIIEFPFFILHALKVLITTKGIRSESADKDLVPDALDDKKLVDCFARVVNCGIINDEKISENKDRFAKNFIICLLRTRFLFDKFIIKREFENENSEGEWSLKNLHVSGQQSKKKPYYSNTRFAKKYKWEDTNNELVKKNIMIQSALRVSYTSPKGMHWITKLLLWLSENDYKHSFVDTDDMSDFDSVAEKIAQDAVIESFFKITDKNPLEMGVNTPHIVFNYLDYLLWTKRYEKDYREYAFDSFVFEFRNSVEHWYPRHPSEGTFDQWSDGVDRFGNLCLIQRNVNSKFSNMSPEAKKSTYEKMIGRGSLKLRIMSQLTKESDGKTASTRWRESVCEEHEQRMIELLNEACKITNGV